MQGSLVQVGGNINVCNQNESYVFSSAVTATCLNSTNAPLSGWIPANYNLAQYASMVHDCEYESSPYTWRPCMDASNAVASSTQDSCENEATGNTWLAEVYQRCLQPPANTDAGDPANQAVCESRASGNTWFADRWVAENAAASRNVGVAGVGAGLSWGDMDHFAPNFVPPEGRCVVQTYISNGNNVRDYKCVPVQACGSRCVDGAKALSDCSMPQTISNLCGYGECKPDKLVYGNESEIPPPFDYRCWDRCAPGCAGWLCMLFAVLLTFVIPQLQADHQHRSEVVPAARAK